MPPWPSPSAGADGARRTGRVPEHAADLPGGDGRARRPPARQPALVRLGRHLAPALFDHPQQTLVRAAPRSARGRRGRRGCGVRRTARRRAVRHRRVRGRAPRTGEPVPELVEVEGLFTRKNFGIDEMPHDGRHAWLRLPADAVASWDFPASWARRARCDRHTRREPRLCARAGALRERTRPPAHPAPHAAPATRSASTAALIDGRRSASERHTA